MPFLNAKINTKKFEVLTRAFGGNGFGVKQVAMEVWEVEDTRQRKVMSGVLGRPVSHCCVLETSKLIFSCQETDLTLRLDLLLVILVSSSQTRFGENRISSGILIVHHSTRLMRCWELVSNLNSWKS